MQNLKCVVSTNKQFTRHGEPVKFREGLYRLANGVYAWMVPNGAWGETNIGLVDCGGKSILIDTCWDLRFTNEMLDATREIMQSSPIEVVINTHSDGDHCWGNQLFSDKEIIATHACIAQIHHNPPKSINALRSGCNLCKRVSLLSLNVFANYVDGMFGPYDFSDVKVTPPTTGFSHEHSFSINGIEIVVMEVGPAHTNGDAFVYLPDKRVVYAGDIAFIDCTPVMWAGPVDNVVASLEKLLALKVDWIVPGHGPLANKEKIQLLIDYWVFVHDNVYQRFQLGMDPYEASLDLFTSKLFRASPFAQWNESERLLTNTVTLYRQWGAKVSSLPAPLSTMNMLRRQAILQTKKPGR